MLSCVRSRILKGIIYVKDLIDIVRGLEIMHAGLICIGW